MKHFKMVLLSIVLPLVALGSHPSGAEDSQWQARLSIPSSRVLVGEPVSIRIEIVNRSEIEIVMPLGFGLCAKYCCLSVIGPESDCLGGPGCAAVMPLPIYLTKQTYEPGVPVVITSDSYYPRCPGTYAAQFACNVPESAAQPEQNLKTFAWESNDEVWTGSFSSNEVSFEVVQPEGIDKEAYEALGPNLVADSQRNAELLRRFPTSTYAAYGIWHDFARGVSSDQNSVDVLLRDLRASIESQSNSVPCDIPDWCDDQGWMSLQGEIFVRWRTERFGRILKYHPGIWFADEVRLKLALDRYRLGDKAACAAGLEALAAHGRHDVAAKAGELLEAMRSKAMLPGGEKDLATPQTESPATASAGQ